ncbi:hypothetical protein CTO_1002 [Chlamydia trachomatis A2497]|uniref:Uncharacterized protein n=1 Tax=Chlamydia trachomatis serovar A (strain A2497) TaxID=580047 RepID=G4NNM9_CHLT4|nr:hypothetical protein CTO_1002 [Chlamydia trachomatis A2497]
MYSTDRPQNTKTQDTKSYNANQEMPTPHLS